MDGQAPVGGELWAGAWQDDPPSGSRPVNPNPGAPSCEDVSIGADEFYAEKRAANRRTKERADWARFKKSARAREAGKEIERTAELIDGRIYLDLERLLGPIATDTLIDYVDIWAWSRPNSCRFPRSRLRAARDAF